MRLRYTFSTRTRTSTMGSPTRRTRAQLQRPRETIRTGPLLLAAAFFSFCHGSFGLQHSDPHPRAGSKASPGQDRSHLVREFMASKTNWTEPRDDCTELKHPQQRQPPRDGVLRAGGGLQHEQSLVALLPITSSEHHASALAVLDRPIEEGGWRLICAWFSGVEGADTVTIFVSTLQQGSTTWSGPKEVAREPGASLQNPVWLIEKGSKAADSLAIRLLYTSQEGLKQETSRVMQIVSRDGGQTWVNPPRVVLSRPGSFIKSPPIRSASSMEWLLPIYHTPEGAIRNIYSQYSELLRSMDGGESWGKAVPMSLLGQGLVQPSIVRMPSGRLVAFFRSRYSKTEVRSYIHRSESTDDGRTWSPPIAMNLPNPNKSVQACVLESGALMIVFNNNRGGVIRERGADGRKHIQDSHHYPLSVALSFDEGMTWPYVRDLEEEYDHRLEYSYPSIVQTPDGWVHVTHTWSQWPCRRSAIRYHRISEEWAKGRWGWGSTRGLYKPQPLEHTAVPQLRVREIPVARSNENVAQRLMAVSAASFEGAAEMLQCQTAMFAAFCVIVAIGLAVHCRSLGGVILSQGAEKT